jgi:hypothetical protein
MNVNAKVDRNLAHGVRDIPERELVREFFTELFKLKQ